MGSHESGEISRGDGITPQLSQWIHALKPSDVPQEVFARAKYQILDGIGCGLVGARVPWSEQYVKVTAEYEAPGEYSVIGYKEVHAILC